MVKKIAINISKCTGCNQCVLTCSFEKTGLFDPHQSNMHVVQWEDICLSVPLVCQQCEDAQCILVCPVEALSRHPETGAILLDAEACIGCKQCVLDCTYQVMHMTDAGLPATCDLCNGDPACVKACYPGALSFVEVPDDEREPLRRVVQVLVNRAAGGNVTAPDELREGGNLIPGAAA